MPALLLLTFAVALALSLLLVPIFRELAIRIGLVDQPDAERKLHSKPIALAGGVAVFSAMFCAMVAVLWADNGLTGGILLPALTSRWYVLLAGAIAILIVGLVDDAWALRGRQKLLAQCLIAMVIVGSGTMVDRVSFFGMVVQLGVFAIPVSVLWLLIAINALNLLDGADGMATTVGLFVTGGLALLSFQLNADPMAIAVSLALCGALSGFLFYNRPPASIFLGDAGSMTIGLVVGVLAMWCSVKEHTVMVAAPIAILILPLLDSSAAILRRWMTGRSIYATDRAHMHHLLQQKFGRGGMLIVVAILCSLSTATAVLSVSLNQQWIGPLGALMVLVTLILTHTFGYSESRLLLGRGWHLTQSFFVHHKKCEITSRERNVQLQGEGRWDTLWEPLVAFAKQQQIASVKIDINMAWLHEGYHATWQSVRLPEKAFQSVLRVPLFASRRGEDSPVPVGRLEIIAAATEGVQERLCDFLEHVPELQQQIDYLVLELDEIASQRSEQSGWKRAALNGSETRADTAAETIKA